MSKTELIALAQTGARIPRQEHSLFDYEQALSRCQHPNWRTIVCDGDNDVVECSCCGQHRVVGCNFDDEYA